MQKHLAMFTAASLVLGGWAYGQQQQDQARPGQQQAQQQRGIGDIGDRARVQAQLPTGTIRAEEQQTDEIKKAVIDAAEAVLTAERFDQILEHLSSADRERLEQEADREQIDQQLAQLRERIQQRHDDLELSAEQVFDEQVQVVQAEVVAPAILVRFPVEPGERQERPGIQQDRPGMQDRQPGQMGQPGQDGATQQPGAARPAQPGATGEDRGATGQPGQQPGQLGQQQDRPAHQPGYTGADRQPAADRQIGDRNGVGIGERDHGLEAGDQIALVTFPQRDNLQRVTVSLVQEDNEWKLNIPDHVDAQTIQRNLSRQLEAALLRDQHDRQPGQLGQPGQQDRQPGQLGQPGQQDRQPGQLGQPGQQDRQPGQQDRQPGQLGQPGQQDRQPGQLGERDRDEADKTQAKAVHAVMLALYDVDAQPGMHMRPGMERPGMDRPGQQQDRQPGQLGQPGQQPGQQDRDTDLGF